MDEIKDLFHELQTPLSNLEGVNILINNENDIEKIKSNYMPMMDECVAQLRLLINDYKIYIKTGDFKINYSTFDLKTIIEKSIINNKNVINRYNITISKNLHKAVVRSDKSKVLQIINNLVSNACKYGGDNIKIECKQNNDISYVKISDNGIGMSEEECKNITKPFYRSKKIDRPGTGLGLSISKRISEKLNIRLSMSSEDNIGSIFELIFFNE